VRRRGQRLRRTESIPEEASSRVRPDLLSEVECSIWKSRRYSTKQWSASLGWSRPIAGASAIRGRCWRGRPPLRHSGMRRRRRPGIHSSIRSSAQWILRCAIAHHSSRQARLARNCDLTPRPPPQPKKDFAGPPPVAVLGTGLVKLTQPKQDMDKPVHL
jgi:hypothetical protein